MPQPTVSEAEFIRTWHETGGSASAVSKKLGLTVRAIYKRRLNLEHKLGSPLTSSSPGATRPAKLPPGRLTTDIPNGIALIGSDAHIWPGSLTTAQRAFIHFAKELKPSLVVLNGDLFDGATVSRHPAGMWSQERRPNVRQELEACQSFMDAVVKASGAAARVWTFGNHDARFEARLAALTPEYEGVPGFALKDHFQEWTFGMSIWVNDEVVIKHRHHNGIHAVYNNTLKGGKTLVTGHLHSLKVTPWTDYNGTRYGVDTGTLADVDSAQFDYLEDNAKNWRAGFAVLSFANGKLLQPELVEVFDDNSVQFRGKIWSV